MVFSANEMVVVTAMRNPLGIRRAGDPAKPEVDIERFSESVNVSDAIHEGVVPAEIR